MSMIANFVAITSDQLQNLIADPDSVTRLLYPDNEAGEPEGHLDIDKAWQGIHFLLTGDAWEGPAPWALAVMGGTEIGEDAGYGPARYLRPDQVREVADALTSLPREEIAQRYAPAEMEEAGVYPEIWVRDGDQALGYLLEYYDLLVEFYQQAASKRCAVLQYLN
jgi:hypothetical protein